MNNTKLLNCNAMELTTFLNKGINAKKWNEYSIITGLYLTDIIQNKKRRKLFIDWLEHCEEAKTNSELLMVSYAMIEYLQDKKLKDQQYTKGEMINCYSYNKQTGNYILCVNSKGHCHISNVDYDIEYLGSYCQFIENILKQYN